MYISIYQQGYGDLGIWCLLRGGSSNLYSFPLRSFLAACRNAREPCYPAACRKDTKAYIYIYIYMYHSIV